MAKSNIKPIDLVETVKAMLDEHPGEWTSPQELWKAIRERDPGLAEQVEDRVKQYADPQRNNAVWFLSNTLYHVGKDPAYELSDKEKVPEMADRTLWLVVRAVGK
jgi:hypothetical protein